MNKDFEAMGIHFLFPISYGGKMTKDISPPFETTDETVCLLAANSENEEN